jgi:hypothetical protein
VDLDLKQGEVDLKPVEMDVKPVEEAAILIVCKDQSWCGTVVAEIVW